MADIAQLKGEKVNTTRKAKLDDILKDAPESVKKMYEANFAAMHFDTDEAYDAWLEGTKTTVEGLVNDLKAKGAITHPPMGGGQVRQKGEVNPALKAQVEAQKAATTAQAGNSAVILGMPTAQ